MASRGGFACPLRRRYGALIYVSALILAARSIGYIPRRIGKSEGAFLNANGEKGPRSRSHERMRGLRLGRQILTIASGLIPFISNRVQVKASNTQPLEPDTETSEGGEIDFSPSYPDVNLVEEDLEPPLPPPTRPETNTDSLENPEFLGDSRAESPEDSPGDPDRFAFVERYLREHKGESPPCELSSDDPYSPGPVPGFTSFNDWKPAITEKEADRLLFKDMCRRGELMEGDLEDIESEDNTPQDTGTQETRKAVWMVWLDWPTTEYRRDPDGKSKRTIHRFYELGRGNSGRKQLLNLTGNTNTSRILGGRPGDVIYLPDTLANTSQSLGEYLNEQKITPRGGSWMILEPKYGNQDVEGDVEDVLFRCYRRLVEAISLEHFKPYTLNLTAVTFSTTASQVSISLGVSPQGEVNKEELLDIGSKMRQAMRVSLAMAYVSHQNFDRFGPQGYSFRLARPPPDIAESLKAGHGGMVTDGLDDFKPSVDKERGKKAKQKEPSSSSEKPIRREIPGPDSIDYDDMDWWDPYTDPEIEEAIDILQNRLRKASLGIARRHSNLLN